MNNIIRIYKTIEDKLPFSIIRNEEGVEEEINTALDQIFMEYGDSFKEQISYLSYAYADIDYTNYQDLTEWKIKDFVKHFYFKDLYQEHVPETLKLLNQYFLLRKINYTNSATSPINSKYASTPLALSQLLDKALIIKINVGSSNHFSNKVDENLFHFTIKKEFIEHLDFDLIPNQVISQIDNSVSYSINDFDLYPYENTFSKLKNHLIGIYTELNNKLSEEDYFKSKKDVYIQEFICSIISVAFLSLKYNSVIYYIPSIVAKDNTGLLHNLGALIIGLKEDVDANEKLFKFKLIADRISQTIALGLTKRLYLEVIHHSTRAAISQVMARNMSHNIGSHVLSKLLKDDQIKQIFFKNKGTDDDKVKSLEEINAILTNNKLFYQCLNALKDIDIEKSGENILSEDKNKETNESLLAYFFDYLKARMDYLADVTTSTPVMENTKGLYNDMVKPFIKNRVLNDRISGLDKFYYEITVCKPDSTKNGKKKCEKINTKKDCSCCVNDENSNKDDIQLSIPNDVLGVQAFYNILENIIRNTAKHGTTPVKKESKKNSKDYPKVPFEFKIKVEEASQRFEKEQKDKPKIDLHLDEYYCISIFDNCDLNTETEIDPSEFTTDEDKKKIIIYQEKKIVEFNEKGKTKIKIKKIDKLVIDQNFILNKSILEDNQLRHGGWGLIEMDTSAAYLRKIDVELIDSDEYSITDFHGVNPITEGDQLCIYQAYAEQDKYLGYRFFIRKPQEILIIGDFNQLLSIKNKTFTENDTTKQLKELKSKGIWIKSKDEIERVIKDKTDFPHRLVVIDKTHTELLPSIQNNPKFSRRILKDLCTAKICCLLNFDPLDILRQNITQFWQYYYNSENYKTYHDDGGIWETDNHGKSYCKFVNVDKKTYVEIFNSATNHFFNVSAEKDLNKKYSWPLNIVVIDERIQYFAKYGKYSLEKPGNSKTCEAVKNGNKSNCWHDNGVPYSMLYKKTNILIPDMENNCNLNEQNFSNKTNGEDQYDKIIKYIIDNFVNAVLLQKNTNYNNIEKTEFLVIHLGIIEKLITAWNNKKAGTTYDKEKKGEVGKFIREKILTPSESDSITVEVLNSLYNRIIVTSGRGKPHNLPDDIRYLNFSVISQYMITQRCKYAFIEALFSARKTF